ncbi:UNVERIFIED_CONTAM: hypothetical protein Scaly_2863800 [Sesamum calycinum]|uniref:DUF4283 domain-containing protein n=1 Tax=Sesamum calycinum TaxID=2727403 RepID=A0AAW2LK68_9LAMI
MWVLKWNPEFWAAEESPIAPVWVSLPGLSIHLFDKTTLFSIVRLLGLPLKLDETTTKKTRPSVARICVELDLTKKRICEICIGRDSKGIAQNVMYEILSKYCIGCKDIGHDWESCYVKWGSES